MEPTAERAVSAAADGVPAMPLVSHSPAAPVPAPGNTAQDMLALALVAIAAGSLLWRVTRSVRGFIAIGQAPQDDGLASAGAGGGHALWAGGCGGGCSGCPSQSVSLPKAATQVVTISPPPQRG